MLDTSIFKKPAIILYIIEFLFSIIVFATIADIPEVCIFNNNPNACNLAICTGVIAFMLCITFVSLQLFRSYLEQHTPTVNTVEVAACGLWTFMWFITFCVSCDQWRKSHVHVPSSHYANNARACIAFSFFSIISWAASTYFSFQKYRNLDNNGGWAQGGAGAGGFSGAGAYQYQGEGDDFNPPPFTGSGTGGGEPSYQSA